MFYNYSNYDTATVGVKITSRSLSEIVKRSLELVRRRLPSSSGANLASRAATKWATTVRSSIKANCLPTQELGPRENGAKASFLLTISGLEHHLSGMNSEACSKQLSTINVFRNTILVYCDNGTMNPYISQL